MSRNVLFCLRKGPKSQDIQIKKNIFEACVALGFTVVRWNSLVPFVSQYLAAWPKLNHLPFLAVLSGMALGMAMSVYWSVNPFDPD